MSGFNQKKMLKFHARVYKGVARKFGAQSAGTSNNVIWTMYRHALAPLYAEGLSVQAAETLLEAVQPEYVLTLTKYASAYREPYPAVIAWVVAGQQPEGLLGAYWRGTGADVASYSAELFMNQYPQVVSDTSLFAERHDPDRVAALADYLLIVTAQQFRIS